MFKVIVLRTTPVHDSGINGSGQDLDYEKNDKNTKPLFYPKPLNPLYANSSNSLLKESSSNFKYSDLNKNQKSFFVLNENPKIKGDLF